MKSHKDLTVYKEGILFVTTIYLKTGDFPKNEIFGLTSQIRRSAISIPSNIAEGLARNHVKEKIQFLYVALGSASELNAQLEISLNLNFLDKPTFDKLDDHLNSISKMLQGLIKSLKSKLDN